MVNKVRGVRKSTAKDKVVSKSTDQAEAVITRAARPRERIPVSGQRDLLTVIGKDPNYHYRWVEDNSENGQRIFIFLRAGYAFVNSDEVSIGQDSVYTTENVGSIVRRPAGNGKYFFLMKQTREDYEADQNAKQREIDALEEQITRPRNPNSDADDGQYGSNSLSYETK